MLRPQARRCYNCCARKGTRQHEENEHQWLISASSPPAPGTSTPSTRTSASSSATWWSPRPAAASATSRARVTIAEDPLQSKVEATVQTTSVDTGDEGRDGHLRTGDFFEAETYPTITFVSTSITPDGDDYTLTGDLTIKGVTKPVTFDLEFEGVVTDPWGNTQAGFSAETEVNRKEWGLDYNAVLEAGGVLIGEKVKLSLEIEAAQGR